MLVELSRMALESGRVGKKVSKVFESEHSFASKAMREAPAMFKQRLRANTKVKDVDGDLGCNKVGGE